MVLMMRKINANQCCCQLAVQLQQQSAGAAASFAVYTRVFAPWHRAIAINPMQKLTKTVTFAV
jgi:hypothetical protein